VSLDIDAVLDRRRLKRRLAFWRTSAIVVFVAVAVVLAQWAFGDLNPLGRGDHVARLNVVGVIVEDQDVLDRLDEIAEDDAAKALLIYIDSPGGTVVGGESLFKAFRRVAAEKPVVAVMGTTAASAGYMVALGADSIFAHEGTVTGSIGVLLQTAEITDLLERLGVNAEAIKSAPLKAVPSPLEELTPSGRAAAQEVVDQMYAMFVEMVGERRGLSGDELRAVSDGRVFTGRSAVTHRLVDAIGGEREAREWLESEHSISADLPSIDRDVKRDSSVIGRLARALGGKTLFSERLMLDGLVAVWHPDLRS